MKKNDQITRTRFLEKYKGLSVYDIDFEKDIQLMTKEFTLKRDMDMP